MLVSSPPMYNIVIDKRRMELAQSKRSKSSGIEPNKAISETTSYRSEIVGLQEVTFEIKVTHPAMTH